MEQLFVNKPAGKQPNFNGSFHLVTLVCRSGVTTWDGWHISQPILWRFLSLFFFYFWIFGDQIKIILETILPNQISIALKSLMDNEWETADPMDFGKRKKWWMSTVRKMMMKGLLPLLNSNSLALLCVVYQSIRIATKAHFLYRL